MFSHTWSIRRRNEKVCSGKKVLLRERFSLVLMRIFSLAACYLLLIQSLLVTRCKITHHSSQSSLITRWRIRSFQNIPSSSLRNSFVIRCRTLVAKSHSLLVQNSPVTRCKKSLVTNFKVRHLFPNSCYSLQNWSHLLQLF